MESQPKTVLVDMDGVLADFNKRVEEILKEDYPDVPVPQTRDHFYIDDDMDPIYKPVIKEIISRAGFFTELPLEPGAVDGWANIVELGYRPQICTSPLRKNPTCNPDKLAWLEEYFVPQFGHWVVDTAIIDKDKSRHAGIALIDDRPYIKGTEIASWKHVIFDQQYNKTSEAPYRLQGWKDTNLTPILGTLATATQH
jgi:5'-nucleotidase